MKNWLVSIFLIATIPSSQPGVSKPLKVTHPTGNIFIIGIDGFRWQEVFAGADSALIYDECHTLGAAMLQALYGDRSPELRRKKN